MLKASNLSPLDAVLNCNLYVILIVTVIKLLFFHNKNCIPTFVPQIYVYIDQLQHENHYCIMQISDLQSKDAICHSREQYI